MKYFYPSIASNLFKESIEFTKQFIHISADHLSFIIQAIKTLFKSTTPWIKKSSTGENFDVPMSYFGGVEKYKLVGTYITSKLTNIKIKEDVGL